MGEVQRKFNFPAPEDGISGAICSENAVPVFTLIGQERAGLVGYTWNIIEDQFLGAAK